MTKFIEKKTTALAVVQSLEMVPLAKTDRDEPQQVMSLSQVMNPSQLMNLSPMKLSLTQNLLDRNLLTQNLFT